MTTEDDTRARTVVGGHHRLVQLLGEPMTHVADKVRTSLHPLDRDWIDASTLCMVGTAGSDGRCDVSPKGDPSGGFGTLDPHTVVIPERPGNRRADGYHSILDNPHVGILFLIAGRHETLRVNGRATVVEEAWYFDDFTVNGHRPRVCLEVAVEEVFYHCGKALIRSEVWKPDRWRADAVPRRAVIAKTVEQRTESLPELDSYYGPSYASKTYVETAPPRPDESAR